MGLDATLVTGNGAPLGQRGNVVATLSRYFPGSLFGWLPSGQEQLALMRQRGIEPPDVMREHLERQPAKFRGDWEGPTFGVEFHFGSDERIQEIDVVLRGKTTDSDGVFGRLQHEQGWWLTFP